MWQPSVESQSSSFERLRPTGASWRRQATTAGGDPWVIHHSTVPSWRSTHNYYFYKKLLPGDCKIHPFICIHIYICNLSGFCLPSSVRCKRFRGGMEAPGTFKMVFLSVSVRLMLVVAVCHCRPSQLQLPMRLLDYRANRPVCPGVQQEWEDTLENLPPRRQVSQHVLLWSILTLNGLVT